MRARAILALLLSYPVLGLAQGRQKKVTLVQVNNWPAVVTDSKGYRWDMYYYGHIQQGTNNTFSQGMYLYVNNQQFRLRNSRSSLGRMSTDRRQMVLGPVNVSNVNVTRTLLVSADLDCAVFVDQFANTAAAEAKIQVKYTTRMNHGTQNILSSKGLPSVTPEDTAVVTDDHSVTSNGCAVAHLFCGKRAKVRPHVSVTPNNNTIEYRYTNLSLPSKGTIVLVHVLAQRHSFQEAVAFMKGFKPRSVLKVVPRDLRKLAANFPTGTVVSGIDIELPIGEDSDIIELPSGEAIKGTLVNESFALKSYLGSFQFVKDELAAVIGAEAHGQRHLIALKTGEVLLGDLGPGDLSFQLVSGRPIVIPSSKQFRIGLAMPGVEELKAPVPCVLLHTGEVLKVEPTEERVQLSAFFGDITVPQKQITRLTTPDDTHRYWMATLADGSEFACVVRNPTLKLKHPTIGAFEVPLPAFKTYLAASGEEEAEEEEPQAPYVRFRSGDEVTCRVASAELHVATHFATIPVATKQCFEIKFGEEGEVTADLCGGGTVEGRLQERFVEFEGGLAGKIRAFAGHIDRIVVPRPQLPPALEERIKALILKLGAEDYKEREAAQDTLSSIGKAAAPVLKHAKETIEDAEVLARLDVVLKKLTK